MMLLLAIGLFHDGIVSSSRLLARDREVRVDFAFRLEDLSGLARLDANRDGRVDPDEWRRVLPAIRRYVEDRFEIFQGDERLTAEEPAGEVPPEMSLADGAAPVHLSLRYRSARRIDRVRIRCGLFREHAGNPRHVAELPGGQTLVFDRERAEAERPVGDGERRARAGAWGWTALGGLAAAAAGGSRLRRRRAEAAAA